MHMSRQSLNFMKICFPFFKTELFVVLKLILAFDLLEYVTKKYNVGNKTNAEIINNLFLVNINGILYLTLLVSNNYMVMELQNLQKA